MIITIPLEPVAKARARVGKGHAYTPQKTKDFEEACKWWMVATIAQSSYQLELKPLSLKITFYLTQPKKSKYDYPIGRPDLDNLVKSIKDSGNGILWEDDSQIVELYARKLWDKEGSIVIEIEEVKCGH